MLNEVTLHSPSTATAAAIIITTIITTTTSVADADAAFHCRHCGNPHRLSRLAFSHTQYERRCYADDRCGGLGFQQLQMARDMLAGNPTCADLPHQHTLLSSLGCQATRAAEDVLAARASAHTHELNELRRELAAARDDATRCAHV
jgi:hypothetical protein